MFCKMLALEFSNLMSVKKNVTRLAGGFIIVSYG
jgi:hypothetical protein